MATERLASRYTESGGDDGYDWIDYVERRKWRVVSAWGADGWDLGSWPLVSFAWRSRADGLWDVVEHVEGDLTYLEGATLAERNAWLDMKAVWFWQSGQSLGPVNAHVDADGNPTEHQDWSNKVNLVLVALGEYLKALYVKPSANSWEWWDQLRAVRGVEDSPAMLNGWVLPEWRNPYSSNREVE